MSRVVRAIIAVAFVALIVIASFNRLPAPAANGAARRCEVPAEQARPLDLGRFVDRAHLRGEAATAESWAIAYSDVSPERKQGAGPYADALNRCMTTVFATVAARHAIDSGMVRAYAQQRNIVFDAAVLLAFALVYVVIAYQVAGAMLRQLSDQEPLAVIVVMLLLSGLTLLVTMPAGDTWSVIAEIIRVGNGHLSYRTERVPWRQHQPIVIALALGAFWLVAALRGRAQWIISSRARAPQTG